MGSGKTSWAIQEMNTHKDKSYIYITPFLDEVDRIISNTDIEIYQPRHLGIGKLENFNELLSTGNNIVSTHSLFKIITDETRSLISRGNYTLILDEVLDVISPYTDIKSGDIELLFKNNFISVDENNYIVWNAKKLYPNNRYTEIQLMAQSKCLVYVDETMLLWHLPIDSFMYFENIYILTYLFDGQIMKAYYDYHNIKYQYKQVCKENGIYKLCDYNISNENRSKYKDLINIYIYGKLNDVASKKTALSATWYKNNKPKLEILKNNITNYFKHKVGAKSETIAWTTFAEYQSALTDNGRKYTRRLTADEKKKSSKSDTEKDITSLKCFIPCNSRATNIYADRYNLAYTVNRFVNPFIYKFFKTKNIELDQDVYALSEMLQWIWRSRIRNMQAINIYIPSKRMRELLQNWLELPYIPEQTTFQNFEKSA